MRRLTSRDVRRHSDTVAARSPLYLPIPRRNSSKGGDEAPDCANLSPSALQRVSSHSPLSKVTQSLPLTPTPQSFTPSPKQPHITSLFVSKRSDHSEGLLQFQADSRYHEPLTRSRTGPISLSGTETLKFTECHSKSGSDGRPETKPYSRTAAPRGSARSSAVDSDSQGGGGGRVRGQSLARSDSLPFSWSESPLEEDLGRQSFGSLGNLWPDTDLNAQSNDDSRTLPEASKLDVATAPPSLQRPADGALSSDSEVPVITDPMMEEVLLSPGPKPPTPSMASLDTDALEGCSSPPLPPLTGTVSIVTTTGASPTTGLYPTDEEDDMFSVHSRDTLTARGDTEALVPLPRQSLGASPRSSVEMQPALAKAKKRKTSIFRKLTSLGHEGRSMLLNSRRSSTADLRDLHSTGESATSPRMPPTRIILSLASMLVGNKPHSPRPREHKTRIKSGCGDRDVTADVCLPSPGSDKVAASAPTKSSRSTLTADTSSGWVQGRYGSEPTPVKRRASWKHETNAVGLAKRRPSQSTPKPDVNTGGGDLDPIAESSCVKSAASGSSPEGMPHWPGEGDGSPYASALRVFAKHLRGKVVDSEPFRLSLEHHYGQKNALSRYCNLVSKVVVWAAEDIRGIFSFGPLISTSSAMTSQQVMPLFIYKYLMELVGTSETDIWCVSPSDRVFDGVPLPYADSHKSLLVSFSHKSYTPKEIDGLITLYGMLSECASCPTLRCCYNDGSTTHFVFEFLEGLTLTEFLDQSPQRVMTEEECQPVIKDLVSFVAFAHDHKLLLRNLRAEAFVVLDRSVPLSKRGAPGCGGWQPLQQSSSQIRRAALGGQESSSCSSSRAETILRQSVLPHVPMASPNVYDKRFSLRLCFTDLSALCHIDEAPMLPPQQPHCNYCAPEMLLRSDPPFNYGFAADMFSLGQVISMLVTGQCVLRSGMTNLVEMPTTQVFDSHGFCRERAKAWRVGVASVEDNHVCARNLSVLGVMTSVASSKRSSSTSSIPSVLIGDEHAAWTCEVPSVCGIQRLPANWDPHKYVAYQLPLNEDDTQWKKMPPALMDLVTRMITVDPALRISAQDALQHSFLLSARRPEARTPSSFSQTAASISLSFSHEHMSKFETETKSGAAIVSLTHTITVPDKLRSKLLDHLFFTSFQRLTPMPASRDVTLVVAASFPHTPHPFEAHIASREEDLMTKADHPVNHTTTVSSVDTLLAEIEANEESSDSTTMSKFTDPVAISASPRRGSPPPLISPSLSPVTTNATRASSPCIAKPPERHPNGTLARDSSLGQAEHPRQLSGSSRTRRGSQLLTAVAHSFKNLFGDGAGSVASPTADDAPRESKCESRSALRFEGGAAPSRRHSFAVTQPPAESSTAAVAQLAEFLETRKRMKDVVAKLAAQSDSTSSEGAAAEGYTLPPLFNEATAAITPDTQSCATSSDASVLDSQIHPSPYHHTDVSSPSRACARSPSVLSKTILERRWSRPSVAEPPQTPSTTPPSARAGKPELFVPSPERWSGRRASCAAMIQPVEFETGNDASALIAPRPGARPYPSYIESRRVQLRGSADAQLPPPLPRQSLAASWRGPSTAANSPPIRSQRTLSQEGGPGASTATMPNSKKDKCVGNEISMMDEDTQTYELLLVDAACQTTISRIEKLHKGTQTDCLLTYHDVGCDQNERSPLHSPSPELVSDPTLTATP